MPICPGCGQSVCYASAHMCPYPFGKPGFINATNPITLQTFEVKTDQAHITLEQRIDALEARVASLERVVREMGQP